MGDNVRSGGAVRAKTLVTVTEPSPYTFDVTVTDPLAMQAVLERGEANRTGRTGGLAAFLGPVLVNLHTSRNGGMWPAGIQRTPAVAGNEATEPEPGRFIIGTKNAAIRKCLDNSARELGRTRPQLVAGILTLALQAAIERTPPSGRIH